MKVVHGIRLAAGLLFAIAATAASAGWEKYGETEAAVFYLDPASIRKDGSARVVWELQDFKKPDGAGALSQRFLWEILCSTNQYRRVATSSHSEPQLRGNVIQLSSDTGPMIAFPSHLIGDEVRPQAQTALIQMLTIPPNSNIAAIHARVCAN